MEQVRIIEVPSRDLIQRLALFAQQEAGWSTAPFELSLVNAFFAVIYGPDHTILASGSVSLFSKAWLGNVIVAKNYRRQGLATKIVRVLAREAQLRRPHLDLCLIASSLGQFVYPKLGFQTVDHVSACRLPPSPPPAPSSLQAIVPTDEQHQAAIRFYHLSAGYSRQNELQAIFEQSKQCAVLIIDDNVVAAAWARFTSAQSSEGTSESSSGVFLGPVVAKYPDYAISVCSKLLRMKEGERPNSSRGVFTLVPQKRGGETRLSVFRSLGFVAQYQMQYMVKCGNNAKDDQFATDAAAFYSTPQYFSLLGYDLG